MNNTSHTFDFSKYKEEKKKMFFIGKLMDKIDSLSEKFKEGLDRRLPYVLNPFNLKQALEELSEFRTWAIRRYIKFGWQHLTRGFSDDQTWCLGGDIARYALPRLKQLRDHHMGYPASLKNDEAWVEIMNAMIWSMEQYLNDGHPPEEASKKERKEWWDRYSKGFKLFGEWLPSLWD